MHGGLGIFTLVDRYEKGQYVESWVDALCLGDLRGELEVADEVQHLVTETMRRVRSNLETLVDGLAALGWQFAVTDPLSDPPPDIASELDRVEAKCGPLPLALKGFAEVVGSVDLVGTLSGWDEPVPDPLVVEITPDYWLSEYELWLDDQGTEWERPGPFTVELAPDRLHKADISGGAPYSLAVPNATVDGLLLGEHHQTTFVNYLRLVLGNAGMGGADHPNSEVDIPESLRQLAGRLIPF